MADSPPRRASKQVDWTVLIIDDTRDNLEIAEAALKYFGAKVYTALNGRDGLALLKEIHPTVILLDIRMPNIDGWQVFHTLRAHPETEAIPVIAVTAHAMDGDKVRILEAGFNGYIAKPFDVFKFVPEIERILMQTSSD
ncbi:MAG: response regulator [Chloroflexi bacterium]|nr:response regulator [Chloroflexota bacterium]